MTSQGSELGQLRRAIDAGNLPKAHAIAKDQPQVSLALALQLTLLIRDQDPDRYPAAARRLLGRIAAERTPPLALYARIAHALAETETTALADARAQLVDDVDEAARAR